MPARNNHRRVMQYVDLVTHGTHGLHITQGNPGDIRKNNLKRTPIPWLSSVSKYGNNIEPVNLNELENTIHEFTKNRKQCGDVRWHRISYNTE